ncbi:hypothetical protein SDC9_125658 [bioreactor metagenome]|uniref:Uncharacterized protein n=1 Tax=bioreactor metagenome TaxID=1076179 RepID=A0A645CP05_9ZZZZ
MPPQHGRTRNRHGVEPFKDASLHIHKQTESRIGDSARNRHQQNAGQQVVHIVIRAGLNGTAKHIDKQQHKRNRHDGDRDNGVHASKYMTHGTREHNSYIADDVFLCRFHLLFLLLPDDCEKYFFQCGLLFNVFNLCGRKKLYQLRERAAHDNPALM